MQRRISKLLRQLIHPTQGWSRTLGVLLKAGISLAALTYIVFRLKNEPASHWKSLFALDYEAIFLLLLVWVMAPLNWGLEAAKWRIMVKPYYPGIRMGLAFRAVLAGITTGIFTPNGFGNFVGRVLYLRSGRRVEATVLSLVDGLAQMGITLWMGGLAVLYFMEAKAALLQARFSISDPVLQGARVLVVAGMLLALFFAAFPHLPGRLLRRWRWIRVHALAERMIAALGHLHRRLLIPVLLLALCRYLVFSTQYLLLMYAFGYEGSISLGLALICTVLLLKSLVPSIALSELGIRESVALAVMGAFGVPALTAFSSTFVLYLINIILPALIGIRYVSQVKKPAVSSESQN